MAAATTTPLERDHRAAPREASAAAARAHQPAHHSRRRRKQSLALRTWVAICACVRKATTAFFTLIEEGKVDMARAMIRGDASLLWQRKPGTQWTACHFAAERGEYSLLLALFEEADRIDSERGHSWAPALFCTGKGPTARGVAHHMVHARTEKNLTPLMLACKRGHPATATFLMTRGSDPCVADREGAKMAIHYASLYGHWACTQVMLQDCWTLATPAGPQPLSRAYVHDVHGLHRYVDARTCAGLTPLHMAAWAGHAEVANILLQHGALLNPQTVLYSPTTSSVLPGSTPTHLAARKNRIHVVRILLRAYLERRSAAARDGTAFDELDPRTIADAQSNYAVMHAIARGNNSMATLLNADASLEVLLLGDSVQAGHFPKLSVLAMAALRRKLLCELDAMLRAAGKCADAEPDPSVQRMNDLAVSPSARLCEGAVRELEAATVTRDLSDSGAGAEHGVRGSLERLSCLKSGPKIENVPDLCGTSIASGSECGGGSEALCGICMEETEAVGLTRCHHSLCAACARKLLMTGAASACQCPFCRTFIGGFTLASPGCKDC